MPAKRRRRRQNNRTRSKADTARAAAEIQSTSSSSPSTATQQTIECSVCRRTDHHPISKCPSHICERCAREAGMLDVGNLRCPCPDQSLSGKVGVVISRVKHLWLSATQNDARESDAPSCRVHEKQSAEFWCQKCEVLICPLCKLAEHEGHKTQTAQLFMASAKQRLVDADKDRLHDFEERLRVAQKEFQKRKEYFHQTRQEVTEAILRRHAELIGIIDRYRDSALLEVEAMAVDVESCLQEDESRLNDELNSLSDLRTRIGSCTDDTDIINLISIDREIQSDWSCDKITVRRSVAFPSYSYELEHDSHSITASNCHKEDLTFQVHYAAPVNGFEKMIDCFIGHPVIKKTPLPKVSLDVKVTPKFRCCEDSGALILSVCPAGAGKLAVSYTTSSDHTDGVTKSFFEDGRPSKSFDFGLCCLSNGGSGFFCHTAYYHVTEFGMRVRKMLPKSVTRRSLSQLQEEGCGWFLTLYFRLPFSLKFIICFSMQHVDAVAPLNFDLTCNSDAVAIVDLKTSSASPFDILKNNRRVVKLLSFSGDTTFTDVYRPPSPDFVPSDVCFICLDGSEVLLVSDMGTSSIHVLNLHSVATQKGVFKKCQFQRYLVADCPMLKCPTALNTDEKGRVWVACKGGQLLTVELDQ